MPVQGAGHIHIGAGSLGLGLICWVTSNAGFRVVLANRPNLDKPNHHIHAIQRNGYYNVREDGGPDRAVTVAEVVPFAETTEEWMKLRDAICVADVQLITTALKEGLEPNIPFLAGALAERARRMPESRVRVIACENGLESRWLERRVVEQLRWQDRNFDKAAFLSAVSFVDCVVDRMCRTPEMGGDGRDVVVMTEPYAQWVVGAIKSDQAGAFAGLLSPDPLGCEAVGRVVKLVDDVEPYVLKKKLLVNGPHLMLAVLARAAGTISIQQYVTQKKAGGRNFDRIMLEARDILMKLAPDAFDREAIENELDVTKKRLIADVRLARSILSRFREHKLAEFFGDYSSKLSRPFFEILRQTKVAPPLMSRCLFVAAHLVEQKKWFRDQPGRAA